MGIERFGAFGGADFDHGAPAAFERLFQQERNDRFERAGFEVIEENVSHKVYRSSGHDGLQMGGISASGAHVSKDTLRSSSRNPPFSSHPNQKLGTL
ncbi:hypothetical protein N8D56_19895 [Devosia sp. A8/3-2]|nr:hypothetical protein N8D56_19895 [Devosia sp. A8/3-2]